MLKKLTFTLALALAVTFPVSSFAKDQDAMSSSKMPKKMKMDAMKSLSMEDKAGMFDKMSDADKMMASKMAGHDMSKMPSSDRMSMMQKMSVADKAAAFDKMPERKRMAMMKPTDKMDKMDKMGKMDKKQ